MAETKNEKLVKVIAYLKQRFPRTKKLSEEESDQREEEQSKQSEEESKRSEEEELTVAPDRLVNKKKVSEFLKNFMK